MNDMQTSNASPQIIQLDQPQAEAKPLKTRLQETEARKAEFYKQLHAGRDEPVTTNVEPQEKPLADNSYIEEYFTHNAPEEVEIESSPIENELDNKLIPKKRFDKEIEKRKAIDEQYQKEREARIRAETELSLYNKALESLNKQQEDTKVEASLDPIDSDAHSYYMNKIRDLENKFESQKGSLSEYEQKQNFVSTVNYQASEIVKKHPDFNDAYAYLVNIEAGKARMMGASEDQAMGYAMDQIRPYAQQAYNNGQNVAELTYNMAKNYGYRPKVSVSGKTNLSPNLENVEKNAPKSFSALDELNGVATNVAPETAAYNNLDGFTRKLTAKSGRGTNVAEFQKALEKLKNASTQY